MSKYTEHTRSRIGAAINQGRMPLLSDIEAIFSEVERLQKEVEQLNLQLAETGNQAFRLLEQNRIMRVSLVSIQEYWNGESNERAMDDACEHNRETAADALAKVDEVGKEAGNE